MASLRSKLYDCRRECKRQENRTLGCSKCKESDICVKYFDKAPMICDNEYFNRILDKKVMEEASLLDLIKIKVKKFWRK